MSKITAGSNSHPKLGAWEGYLLRLWLGDARTEPRYFLTITTGAGAPFWYRARW